MPSLQQYGIIINCGKQEWRYRYDGDKHEVMTPADFTKAWKPESAIYTLTAIPCIADEEPQIVEVASTRITDQKQADHNNPATLQGLPT